MKNVRALVAGAVLAAAGFACALPASAVVHRSGASPLGMGPIKATFAPSEFATHYEVENVVDLAGTPTYAWTLKLQLVDPAGAANPSEPGSAAAVDAKCDSRGVPTGTGIEFVWHHGDAAPDSCNHLKMGPSGHQGVVTVVVTGGGWECTASYDGTNDGVGKAASCREIPKPTPTTTPTTPRRPGPVLIPLHGNPVDDPIIAGKKASHAAALENLQTAKDGGLFAFIPYFKDFNKALGLGGKVPGWKEKALGKALGTVGAAISIIGDATATEFYIAYGIEEKWAQDPPRKDYRVPVVAHVRAPAQVAAGALVTPALAGALNAASANSASLVAQIEAMTLAFERADGAVNAKDVHWESAQAASAASFAAAAAGFALRGSTLRAQLVAALKANRPSLAFSVPAVALPAIAAAAQHRSPPAGLAAALARAGVSARRAWTAILAAPTAAGDLSLTGFLASPGLRASDRKLASSLRALAATLNRIAAKTK